MLEKLRSIWSFCEVPRADGAFHFLLRLDTKLRDMEVVERLIREFRVAVIRGNTFGIRDRCRLRVSYVALRKDAAAVAIERLVRGLRAIIGRPI